MAKTLKYCLILAIVLLSLGAVDESLARRNILSGGITTAFDHNETTYGTSPEDGFLVRPVNRLNKLSIGPLILFDTVSPLNSLSIRYNPNFTYDNERHDNAIDQDLSLTAAHNFSKNIRSSLSNRYLYTNDPALAGNTNSSDFNRGRRRYWSNEFKLASSYSYNAKSSMSGSYSFRILRNEDTGLGGYENYDKHVADLSLQHQITTTWLLGATTSYTRGLFDPPDQHTVDTIVSELSSSFPAITTSNATKSLSNDLSEYRAGANLNWILDPRKTLVSSYEFSGTVYDAILRNNTNLHNFTFGAQYQYTKHLSLAVGGGPSYEKTEGLSGNWDYNAHLDVSYKLAKKSTFTAGMEKGYEQKNFSSNNNRLGRDQGLTDFWDWQLDISRELIKSLLGKLYVSYRNEHQTDLLLGIANTLESNTFTSTGAQETFRQQSVFTRDIYRFGGSISYSFVQYWTTAVSYSYRKQESGRINDSYDEQRFFLTLSFQKELLRW